GGGGGGGGGGKASNIGTGGPGGGGGGGGAGGSTGSNYKQIYNAGAKGGKGGYDGGLMSRGGDGAQCLLENANDAERKNRDDIGSKTFDQEGWESRNERWRDGGSGGNGGYGSRESDLNHNYAVNYHVKDRFNGSDVKTVRSGYISNANSGSITITIPSHYTLGLIEQDRYLQQWNTRSDGQGSWKAVGDDFTLSAGTNGTNDLYAVWKNYKDIFPEGYGSKSNPFVIKDALLIELADYVNSGANTRGVYFKQENDVLVSNILSSQNRGSQWTPIGYNYPFEGDYDGGGYRIRNGEIASKVGGNSLAAVGIFGKVLGSVHNLGVESLTIPKPDNNDARCGGIAGMLVSDIIEKRGGQLRNCYAFNNNINVYYAGGLVGEMQNYTSMSHCHETGCYLGTNKWGGMASIIHGNAKVDVCFTASRHSGNGYSGATNSPIVNEDQKRSGELTWLLNDRSSFDVAWYQDINVESGHRDAYPVLTTASNRVYSDGTTYSNNVIGPLKGFTGKGTAKEPFLVNNKEDLEKVAKYCNDGNKSVGIHFLQTADIDLQGGRLRPIANGGDTRFEGVYDGGGHTISSGVIDANVFVGIFGQVTGTVTRLAVEKMTIKYNSDATARVGGIAGRLRGNAEISNCFVKECTVTANKDNGVGGAIVADMYDNAVVRNCLGYKNEVTGVSKGSICGEMAASGTRMSRCYSDGEKLVSLQVSGATVTQDCHPGLTIASLKDGSTTYDLNNATSNTEPAWFQNINRGSELDDTPVLSSDHAKVYKIDDIYTNDGQQLGKLGKGTEADPYKIGSPEDMRKLIITIGELKRSNFYVRQTADIDLRDSVMVPIGSGTQGFEGHYDGGGYVIKNVTMDKYEGETVGLFNNITGTVERLGIENSTFTAAGSATRVGAIAGKLSGNGVVRNCFVKGSTVDFHNTPGVVVGALVGEQTGQSRMEACYGYKNTVIGQDDGQKHYGYILGYIGNDVTASLLFTDGVSLCADKQSGAQKIVSSETEVSDFRFKGGEVCYLLSGSKNNGTIWRQTFRSDNTPVPNPGHLSVYQHTQGYQTMYTNSNDVPYDVWVTLNPNHDQLEGQSVQAFKADETFYAPGFKLKSYAVERENYDFVGWDTQADGKGEFYATDGEVVPAANLTLYAMWGLKVPAEKAETTPVEVLKAGTVYAVCDGGGTHSPYGYNYNGKLTLRAPEDHIILLTGTVATETADADGKPRDYMTVYDGDGLSDKKLANEKGINVFYSKTNGEKEDVGKVLSSDTEMTIEFVTDGDKCFDGLELLVTTMPDLGGSGTKEAPFQVESVKDLRTVGDYIKTTGDSQIYIQQVADIDMNGEEFEPLASTVENFKGHYDGGGHVIRNGKIKAPQYAGFFSVVTGKVTRLGMEDMTVNYENRDGRSGAIAARLIGNGEISYCYVKGSTVTNNGIEGYEGQGVVGAIVADMFDQAIIKNCFSIQNKVTATRAAHICADTKVGTQIINCYTDGDNLYSESGATIMASEAGIKAERFASGEVCYLLNGSKSDDVVWRQTIGTDNLPTSDESHGVVYCHDIFDKNEYTNSPRARYEVRTVEQFKAINFKEGDIYLMNDLDLGELKSNRKFQLKGNFDGGGHTITYRAKTGFDGLFNTVQAGASVKHLRVKAKIFAISSCAGIAYKNHGIISDCTFSEEVILNVDVYTPKANTPFFAGIALFLDGTGSVDHCSATGMLTVMAGNKIKKSGIPIVHSSLGKTPNYWTSVSPTDRKLYAAQADTALSVQTDYPVYAQGILDVTKPKIVHGDLTYLLTSSHLTETLTFTDGVPFSCPAQVTVDRITYKRRGTNGAYEPWILPFDYTIDAGMLSRGEFCRFEKDSTGNIVTKQIENGTTYQLAANEPLAFRSPNSSEINFEMRLIKNGQNQPMTIKMPIGGEAASLESTKDIARIMVTYDNIAADRMKKELMYVWDNSKEDFVLSDGQNGLKPFRYYLQYVDQATKNLEQYEQTDWARKERKQQAQQSLPQRRAARRSDFSTLTAEGWQPIVMEYDEVEVTSAMLDDYEILVLSDIYDTDAEDGRYAVTAIYEPVEADMTLPVAVPLLVRAKRADAEPLVTDELASEIDTRLKWVEENVGEEAMMEIFAEIHYSCSTFKGRYDVWQIPLPERNNVLSEAGALIFNDTGKNPYFSRIAADDNSIVLHPMSYFFTAFDANTFENLPLDNDRIEIVVYGYTDPSETTGIEDVRGTMDDERGKMDDAYNLQGQKVDDSYRGIFIKNGRKVVRK
ncbi:MAG: InlB B-repeat-containing protein, partial [Prevotella sp.]|nr:InlB B-repeat-containing protein [Prevotella sp.]